MSKKINLRPLGDRIVVEPLSERESGKETKSGIFIPETTEKDRPEQGVVVAVGAGKLSDCGEVMPMTVKVGDKVLFTKYGPDEVKMDGKEYFILSEGSVLAIINE